MPSRRILLCSTASALIAFALVAVAPPARASAWNYGCKGALPVFNESEAIFFNRDLLALLPKGWLKGPLRDFALRDPVDDVVVLAKTTNENSGLAPTMVFTLLDHPDQKLTDEKSSRRSRTSATGADARLQTTSQEGLLAVSDFGFAEAFDIKWIANKLSAPLQ